MEYQANISEAKAYLLSLIEKQANEKAVNWLKQQQQKLEKDPLDRNLFLAFSGAARFFNKETLLLSEENRKEAQALRKGFQPDNWDLLQVTRTYLLLLFAEQKKESWLESLGKLFETADMHEQESLYAALPLLPQPEKLRKRTAEGIRTNITTVFNAVALRNPYPADYLDEPAWNQMVLKAVFMQRPLHLIYRADERANPQLAKMLIHFAHERWAAGRPVMPELWRFVGPYLDKESLEDIRKLVREGEPLEKEAALLACSQSQLPEAKQLLDEHPDVKEKIRSGQLNWQNIGRLAVPA